MALFTGKVYELILEGNLQGKTIKNVFHYGVLSGPGSADNVCSAFAEDFLLAILLSGTGNDCNYTAVNARGVQLATDFDDNVIDETGTVVGGSEPPFVAAGFKLLRPDTLSRHGYKRFAGVPDDYWEASGPSIEAIAKWADIAAALQNGIATSGSSYGLVTQRRQEAGVPVDPPTYWGIAGVGAMGVTTQNTRK